MHGYILLFESKNNIQKTAKLKLSGFFINSVIPLTQLLI